MNLQNEYRSLMLRKAQLLAQEHGGISNIPREKQKELGFDVIAGRKGSFSISVRIPDGELSSKIAELKSELPKITFESAKPDPERIFGKYTPQVSLESPTMDDFWIMQGWYKEEGRSGIRLIRAKWEDSEKTRIAAIQILVEKVLKKDIRDLNGEDFVSNRLGALLNKYYGNSPYSALVAAGYAHSIEEALQHSDTGVFKTDKSYPWEMCQTPKGFYELKENRIAATKWLAFKLQISPREIIRDDFRSSCLAGLIAGQYHDSPYAAFIEACLVTPEDEEYMRSFSNKRAHL